MSKPAFRDSVEWWRRLFLNPPPRLKLPFSRPRPLRHANPEDGIVKWGLHRATSERLDRIARECQRRSDDRMKRAGLKTGCERAFIFFKSFSQNSSSFVLFFVLFGGARGLDFLRSCTIQATESAAHFESADEFPIKV